MKLIGIILIFLSVSFVGFEIGSKYISELKGIKRAEILLKNIILCIESENMTLKEIFENDIVLYDKNTEEFIFELNRYERKKVAQKAIESGFCNNKSAVLVLEEAFSVLGKFSSEDQIREIGFCRNRLNDIYKQNEPIIKSRIKLARISGILAGSFISILFL